VARAGATSYPTATQLLITADAGGSNSYRSRVFKAELAALAADTGLDITVCHFPPGTSKWNKIEHRLFSHITHNWRGRPLTSHEVVVNTIAATTTRTGLRVHAELDDGRYPLGVTISDEQMAALPITAHDWRGDWNYTLHHRTPAAAPTAPTTAAPTPPRRDSTGWTAPPLTGMTPAAWNQLTTALALPYAAYREAHLHVQRGGPSRRKPGAGHPGPTHAHPRGKTPGHRPAGPLQHPPTRPRRTVRRGPSHHLGRPTTDQTPTRPGQTRHHTHPSPTQNHDPAHHLRHQPRHHPHTGHQISVLIRDNPLRMSIADGARSRRPRPHRTHAIDDHRQARMRREARAQPRLTQAAQLGLAGGRAAPR
jgi:hypothetical protein